MASIETGLTLPLIGHLYDHTGATFKRSFRLLNTPDLSLAINGQGASSLTLELDAALSGGNAAPAKGDILTLSEDGPPSFNGYAAVVLADSPVGYFPLSDTGATAVDLSGHGYSGTLHGGVITGARGVANAAGMLFDGSSGYVQIPGAPFPNALPVTIEAWVRVDKVGSFQLIAGRGVQTANGYGINIDNATNKFNLGYHGGGNFDGATTAVVGGIYHLVGVVQTGTNASHLYVNGVLDGSGTLTIPAPTLDVFIGSDATPGFFYQGIIDQVAFYNYALSAAQAAAHYAAGVADSSVIFRGIVEDFPDERGSTNVHEILVNPVGVQLGDTPFTTNYTSATDIGQMARDIVTACPNLTFDTTSIPLVGTTAIFDFSGAQGYTCLSALDELRKMAGVNYYFWPDTSGKVWFLAANIAGPATHSIMVAPGTEARKYTAPVSNRKNIVTGYGDVLSGATAPISATYDNSAGSPLGKRALVPPLTYSQLTDSTTLQSIVNTVGSILDREHVTVELDLVNYPKRVQPGDVLRYFEETVNERVESTGWPATGAYSPNYVVLQVKQNGPRQSVVASDIPTTLDDLKYLIDQMIAHAASGAVAAVTAGSTGTISPGMIGGTAPSTPAAPTLATAVERVAQADNASISVTWLANPGGDHVVTYKVRWRQGSGPYHYEDAGGGSLTLTLHGLTPGLSYGFSVAAVNSLGNLSAYSTEATITAASDSTAPATPTGLAAIKTPRGALVSWNGNTELDLQGYELQVSVGGGGFTLVTPGPTLVTSLAYVAPSGTAQGTSLQFQVRALDWTGNASAWSASSTAVNTDGIVFDELLAGNVKVFGTLTTGGLQTAASGARVVLDSTSLRIYDGSGTNYGAPSGAGVTAELKNDGTAFFKGTISASSVYGSTIATSSVVGTTGNAGFRLSGSFLDFFTIGTSPEGERYYYAPNGSTAFTLAGELAANSTDLGLLFTAVSKIGLQLTNFIALEAVTTDTGSGGRGFVSTQYSTTVNEAQFVGRKARGTQTSPTAIANGDSVMAMYAAAYDGSHWGEVGLLGWIVNGTVAAGSVPSDFVIYTGSSGIVEALRLDHLGHFGLPGNLAVPTLGALQAGIASQSISGTDSALTVETTVAGAAVAAFTAMAIVNYGAAYGAAPRHGYGNVPSVGGAVSPIYFTPDTTTGFTIHTQLGLSAGAMNGYSVITVGT